MDCFGLFKKGGKCVKCEYRRACEYSTTDNERTRVICVIGKDTWDRATGRGEEREKGRDMGMEGGGK